VTGEDDWVAMVSGVDRIVRGRIDDYLAAVLTAGPLVAVPRGANGGRIR
jgi:hypothetical protein